MDLNLLASTNITCKYYFTVTFRTASIAQLSSYWHLTLVLITTAFYFINYQHNCPNLLFVISHQLFSLPPSLCLQDFFLGLYLLDIDPTFQVFCYFLSTWFSIYPLRFCNYCLGWDWRRDQEFSPQFHLCILTGVNSTNVIFTLIHVS